LSSGKKVLVKKQILKAVKKMACYGSQSVSQDLTRLVAAPALKTAQLDRLMLDHIV